ncbi:MAG: hypothetical protein NDI94_03390 [Candidatus Woesearchaeota archaeon]|nr:hypothetical protein [Candidatus Woesearchaeota archaeon]
MAIKIISEDTYMQALNVLQTAHANGKAKLQPVIEIDGVTMVRPLTFKETLQQIVIAYRSGNHSILDNSFDTCSAIAYKAWTKEVKIIPLSEELITLGQDHGLGHIVTNFDGLKGTLLDRHAGGTAVPYDETNLHRMTAQSIGPGKDYFGKTIYNTSLSMDQVMGHPAWLAAVEGDSKLLNDFSTIVFKKEKFNMAMSVRLSAFEVSEEIRAANDIIIPLGIKGRYGSLDDGCGMNCSANMNYGATILYMSK